MSRLVIRNFVRASESRSRDSELSPKLQSLKEQIPKWEEALRLAEKKGDERAAESHRKAIFGAKQELKKAGSGDSIAELVDRVRGGIRESTGDGHLDREIAALKKELQQLKNDAKKAPILRNEKREAEIRADIADLERKNN